MIEELKYFLLGLIQGLAEFFPISSSGHLVLFSELIDLAHDHPLLLSIVVHFATTLSTILIYNKKIFKITRGLISKNQQSISFVGKIIVSTLPIIIIGFVLRDKIEFIFDDSTRLVAIMLIITGLILFFTRQNTLSKKDITYVDALLMGLAQSIAIIPGISRSGVTISMALMCKVDKEKAAE